MRRVPWVTALLLGACSDSTSGSTDCAGDYCKVPASLTLGAILEPPAGSMGSPYEVRPEELEQDSTGVVQLAFPDWVETTFAVHAAGAPSTAVAAQILLSRPSRIAGQPDVLLSLNTRPLAPAVTTANAGATYSVVVTPAAPDDEHYLRLSLDEVALDSGTLALPLEVPTDAIEGTLLGLDEVDVHVRLQGTRDETNEQTTVARARPGEDFAMRAMNVAGAWRIGAEVAFVDPADAQSDLPNLLVSLEALVTCDAAPCALALPSVPSGLLPAPRQYTIAVNGVDAAGISAGIPGVYVDLRSSIPVLGLESAIVSAQAVTQQDGTAKVYLLDGHEYEVTLRAGGSGFASAATTVSAPGSVDGDRLTFELELGPRLVGTVVAANPTRSEAGVAGVVVTAQQSPEWTEASGGGAAAQPTTDDQGAFSLRVDPGVYDLEMTPPEGSSYPRWSADNVQAFEDTSGLYLVLPDGVAIPLHVQAYGQAIAGATVRIVALSDEEGRPPRERARAMTDTLGDATVLLPDL